MLIEISNPLDRKLFIQYLGKHLEDQPYFQKHIQRYNLDFVGNPLGCLTPAYGDFKWFYEGEYVWIVYRQEGLPAAPSYKSDLEYYERIEVYHPNLDILKAFVREALKLPSTIGDTIIKVKHSTSNGMWEPFINIYAQSLEKIYLDAEQKSNLIHQIDSFIQNRDRYVKFGRSYKLNVLLTGVPGSGKTSLVKAIALNYKKTVFALNFNKEMKTDSLLSLLRNIPDDSVVLMEDIDSFFVGRESKDNNITFSTILNMMDGTMVTGKGNIVFLTANNPELLDSALLRPGRIDYIMHFDYPRKQEVREAFRDITENGTEESFKTFYNVIHGGKVTMSTIIDFLFRYPTSFAEHTKELLDQIKIRETILNDKTEKMYV
jgi:hypothetical protein